MNTLLQRRPIVGVMGAGNHATDAAVEYAYQLGQLIAREGWILLNGGRNCGVMEASARGAKEAGGITVGILPDADARHVSAYIDIPIVTDLGSGRNNINVLTSDVIIACRGSAGTLSEVALAVKAGKPVILMDFDVRNLFDEAEQARLLLVKTPQEAIETAKRKLLGQYACHSFASTNCRKMR